MNTDQGEVYLREESRQVIGCAMAVLNAMGRGLYEKPYENALVVEFRHRQIPFAQQRTYPLLYREVKVGEFIPDLIAFNLIIVDTKVINRITEIEVGQMINYLKITGLKVGYIINFKHPKLQWKRVIH